VSGGDRKMTSDTLQILHGAKSLPPEEAAEALRPFSQAMRIERSANELAAAITELARSLNENHAASNDLWLEAIENAVSFAEKSGYSTNRSADLYNWCGGSGRVE